MKDSFFYGFCAAWATLSTIVLGAVAVEASMVTGVVLGPTGKPVKNAHVAVSTTINGKTRVSEMKTDKKGQFTVEVEESSDPTSPYYAARLAIAAPGLALTGGTWRKGQTVFHLQPGLALSGSVVDTNGKPVANSSVLLRSVDGKQHFDSIDVGPGLAVAGKFATKTGIDGRWTIHDVPREGYASIWFDDPRYLKDFTQLTLSPNARSVPPFTARSGVRVAGRVRYETGQPAAGVFLAAEASGMNGTVTTRTGIDGNYLLPSMPVGKFRIRVQEGSGEWVASDLRGQTTPIMQSLTVPDLVLQRGVLLTGAVLDADTGEPLEGALARADGAHSIMVSRPTNHTGRYQLRVVPGKSRFYLTGIPQGYLRERNQSYEIDITPGQTELAPFRLKRGFALTGTALDEAGQPATGAQIRIGDHYRFGERYGWVGTEGIWTIKGIESATEVKLATDNSWEIISPMVVKLPASGPLTLRLRRVK